MHTVICEFILLYAVANGFMHALMAHWQQMPLAIVYISYLKTNYKVIVIIKLMIVIGSGVLGCI